MNKDHDPMNPAKHPAWLLPVMLAVLVIVGVLMASGGIRDEDREDCEADGGRYVETFGGVSKCVLPEEESGGGER